MALDDLNIPLLWPRAGTVFSAPDSTVLMFAIGSKAAYNYFNI